MSATRAPSERARQPAPKRPPVSQLDPNLELFRAPGAILAPNATVRW
jgi:hypothetical protein